jgi:thiol-disulfide isomerase/thioredoxin
VKTVKLSLTWIILCFLGAFLLAMSPAIAADDEAAVAPPPPPVEKAPEIKLGDIPPDFTITDMKGNEFKLSDMIGKKAIVLDFWATWCGWCVIEMPLMQKFVDKYGDKVGVYCVTSEGEEAKPDIEKFIADNAYTMNFIQDPSKEIAKSYGIRGIPHTFVIDINGKVVGDHLGYSDNVGSEIAQELKLNKRQHGHLQKKHGFQM